MSKNTVIDGKKILTVCYKGTIFNHSAIGGGFSINAQLKLRTAHCTVLSVSFDDFDFDNISCIVRSYSVGGIIVFSLDKSLTNTQRQEILEIVSKNNRVADCFYVDGMDDNKCIEFATKLFIDKQLAAQLVSAREAAIEKEKPRLNAALEEKKLVCQQTYELLCEPLYRELDAFKKRRSMDKKLVEISDADLCRQNIILDLIETIKGISDKTDKTQITIDNIDTWKHTYQNELKDAVTHSLSDARLDKYNSYEKWGITLLNIITALFSPIKKFTTGSYFFSTTGKSKEAVEEIKKTIDDSPTFN